MPEAMNNFHRVAAAANILAVSISAPSQAFLHPSHSLPPKYSKMASRSLWRSLNLTTGRRFAVGETSYRCFSCSRRTQSEFKSEKDRMTHFGFSNVPEDKKETMGTFAIARF